MGASVTYNIKMGADAPVSPTTPDVWITSDKKSSVSSYDFLWKTSDLPVTFLTARVKASARNYIQKAMSNTGGFLCNIPVGELECEGKIVGNIQKVVTAIWVFLQDDQLRWHPFLTIC